LVRWLLREERKDPLLTPSPTCKHKLDLLDLGDLPECVDLQDLRASWDLKETLGILDLRDPQALRGN